MQMLVMMNPSTVCLIQAGCSHKKICSKSTPEGAQILLLHEYEIRVQVKIYRISSHSLQHVVE